METLKELQDTPTPTRDELRAKRVALGLTQTAAARVLGKTRNTIAVQEAGTREVQDYVWRIYLMMERINTLEQAAGNPLPFKGTLPPKAA